MPAFPEDSVSEAPASPSVLQEAMEEEELALVTWMASQDSRGPPSRLARVSTRTSMRLESETSSGEAAAATPRNGAMTINNESTAEPADVEANGQANVSSRSGGGFEPTLTIEKVSSRCASSRRP